jgi:hypothetical protein
LDWLRIRSDNNAVRTQVHSILSANSVIPEDNHAMHQLLTDLAQYITVLEKKIESGSGVKPSPQSPDLLSVSYSHSSPGGSRSTRSSPTNSPNVSDTEDEVLADHMKVMTLENSTQRYYGKISNVMFVQTALDMKLSPPTDPGKSPRTPKPKLDLVDTRRPEFWHVHAVSYLHLRSTATNTFNQVDLVPATTPA